MIYYHSIFVVVTVNLDILSRLLNINYIEIHNKTKIGKGFILFTGELKSVPYLVIDIIYNRLMRTENCKVINLSQKLDSFSSRLVYISVYSSIVVISNETHYLQDLVD